MTENAPGGGERRIEEQRKKQSPVGSWIVTRPIPDVAARVRLTRAGVPPTADSVEGTEPNPAEAIRILQTFALHRAIEDLLELAPTPARPPANGTAAESAFDPLDAQTVLALAALIRPVDQAAQLAIGRWAKEGGERAVRTPLTDSIVHDVTAQRTVPEVAKFIHAFRWAGQDGLVRKALEAFSGPRSGRTILDKALLYIALADSRLAEEPSAGWQTQSPDADEAARQAQALNRDAHILLGRVLHAEYGTARAAPGREGAVPETVLGVLRHLSPSKHIVQQWVDEEMRVGGTEKETTELMAVVLLNEGPAENALAEHIGRTWTALNVRNLCALLAGSKARAAGPLLESIRRSAARQDGPNAAANVAELVRLWSRNSRLAPTREDLILEVVTGGTGDLRRPRPFAFLRDIDAALENEGESSRHRDSILEKALLAFVADADEALTVKRADETEQSGQDRETALLRLCGWQGKDIAYLVSRISDRAKLWYTADLVNRTLAGDVHPGAAGLRPARRPPHLLGAA
jgi:hypothetical protein